MGICMHVREDMVGLLSGGWDKTTKKNEKIIYKKFTRTP